MIYTAMRIGLFLACFVVFAGVWVLVNGGRVEALVWPFIAAVLVSFFLSYRLLEGPRERFAQQVQERAARASAKMEEIRSKEDAD